MLNDTEVVYNVHFFTVLPPTQQLNLLKELIERESSSTLSKLTDEEADLIDKYDYGDKLSDEKEALAKKTLHDHIIEILTNITPVIQLYKEQKQTQRQRQDRLSALVIQLVNITVYMPSDHHEEMFTLLLELVDETTDDNKTHQYSNRAALKFCDLLFRHYYHDETMSPSILLKVYQAWLKVAGKCQAIHEGPHSIEQLTSLIARWQLENTEDEARIWQSLFKELSTLSSRSQTTNVQFNRKVIVDLTNKVMLKMLDASYRVLPKEEQQLLAKSCIIHALKDKKIYLYDSLLNAKAMQSIKHTPDYELLGIFTKGMLCDYRRFSQSYHGQAFLAEIQRNYNGLDPGPFLEQKIRQLTFIELAGQVMQRRLSTNGEPSNDSYLTIDKLKKELELKDDIAVEEFVIDAIRTNMVKAKLSQKLRRVIIHHAVPRQFTKEHWHQLAVRLDNWQEQITVINREFSHIINTVAPQVFKQTVAP